MDTLTYYETISVCQANRQFWLDLIVAIISFVSAFIVYIDYKNRKNKERAEKSINIAEDFAHNIIPNLSLLYNFFENSKLIDIVNKHKFISFSDFDVDELSELYTPEELEDYTKKLNESKTITITDSQQNKQDIDMINFIIFLLNELEHMCMYIATEVADEKYIYNSLHQQFIKAIASLYISISITNTDAKDKYYTNIIHVYNLWKNKYIKALKKEERFKKKQKREKKKLLTEPKHI